MSQTHVPLTGRLYWGLIFNFDNTGNTGGEITFTKKARISEKFCTSTFEQHLREHERTQTTRVDVDSQIGGAWKLLSATVKASTEHSEEIQDFVSTKAAERTDYSRESEYEQAEEYKVGAGGKLQLYQLFFDAPGFLYACNCLSTQKLPDQAVDLTLTVQAIEFVSGFTVVSAEDETSGPSIRVTEVNGESSDINSGYIGRYTWLVPQYTRAARAACTGFNVYIQWFPDPTGRRTDLARGTGGRYRYVDPVCDALEPRKITRVHLLRARTHVAPGMLPLAAHPAITGISADLNRGRGEDYLYLVWEAVVVAG